MSMRCGAFFPGNGWCTLEQGHPGEHKPPAADRVDHADYCEADQGHHHDCGTASELAHLRAFAQAIAEEYVCDKPADECDCLHHSALEALEKVPRG